MRAFADAETRFRSALDLLEDAEESEPVEYVMALCGLGEAQRDQTNPAFRETLLEAARRAEELGNTELQVRAVLANTRGYISLVSGVDPERITAIEHALECVPTGPSPGRTRLLARLAEEITFQGDHPRRLALADEAEAMARHIGDDRLLGDVLSSTGFSSFAPDRSEPLVLRGQVGRRHRGSDPHGRGANLRHGFTAGCWPAG
jgi:protein-disulfide isomerase-like protein with CxxC motif